MIAAVLVKNIRTGDWVTSGRSRLWAYAFLIGCAAAVVYLLATAHGLNDYRGRPLGTDFSDVYAAGRLANAGAPAAAYDFVRHHDAERAVFGPATPFYGWHYPPFFLMVAAGLARLPYLPALLMWQGVGFGFYLAALRLLVGAYPTLAKCRLWLLLAIAFPAAFVNLTHGQNGFLTAALWAGALALLERRPILAGILFGLLAYKPQFAILLPVALWAGKRFKALGAAAATVAAMAWAATLVFGGSIWTAFLASTRLSREMILEQGATGFEKIQSVFAFVRHVGGTIAVAYAAQAIVAFAVGWILVRIWRSTACLAVKGGSLILATLLATPYLLDYDLTALAPVLALWAGEGLQRGFRDYEKSILALLWCVPVVTRIIASATYFPAGLVVMILGYLLLARRPRID